MDRNALKDDDDYTSLVIPNREVREIFIEKIQKWFRETQVSGNQKELYDALWSCNCEGLQEHLRNILLDTISYYNYHENYYHALLVGLLLNGPYRIRSNAEMGNGRSDIVMKDDRNRRVVIIEVKPPGILTSWRRTAKRESARFGKTTMRGPISTESTPSSHTGSRFRKRIAA